MNTSDAKFLVSEDPTKYSKGQTGWIKKTALAFYGLSSYTIGFSGLVAIIFAMAGLIPLGKMVPLTDNIYLAIVINIGLTTLFGLQHSVMARTGFKKLFTRFFGHASERSTYIWTTGVCCFVIVGFWQPIDGIVWQAQSILAQSFLWLGFVVGWLYLVAATYAINHWELFGLRQIWFAINDKSYVEPQFTENWMYRFGRHPIMLGLLIGIWSVPTMTATKLVLSICLTIYIFIGVAFEERDLIRQFGQTYLDYKKRVGMFFTIRSEK